jgi:hypothetical protein
VVTLVLENRLDLLVVMPTGHGKSAMFMISPMVTTCTVIMVVPLTILVSGHEANVSRAGLRYATYGADMITFDDPPSILFVSVERAVTRCGIFDVCHLCTKPDLAYPISVVSKHMANPSLEHWIAVKCIFRYLQGTLQFKLRFRGLSPQDVVGYCDADWAGDLEDRRSTTGFVFMMGVEPLCGVANDNPQSFCQRWKPNTWQVHKLPRSHMDDKAHEGIRVHEREEGDGDSM